jgi:hypothetical protein
MGHPPDAGRGINPFLNYGGAEGALLTQAGRGLAAIKQEIEKNGTGVFLLCCVCGNVCSAFVCVCCGKLKNFKHSHWTEEEKECMDYVLNKEAGSSDKKFQNDWMRDCDPKTGKLLRGEMREKNSYIHTSMYIHSCIYTYRYDLQYTHTHKLKDKAYIRIIHILTHAHSFYM